MTFQVAGIACKHVGYAFLVATIAFLGGWPMWLVVVMFLLMLLFGAAVVYGSWRER